MKKTNKLIGLTIGALLISNAFAQNSVVPNQGTLATPAVNAVANITTSPQQGQVGQMGQTVQAVPGLNNFPQAQGVVVPGQVLSTNVSDMGQASLAPTTIAPPKPGNAYERETTPLLREMSRKKAVLEISKLNAEIAKVEADSLKAQQERASPIGKLINVQDQNNAPLTVNPTMPSNIPTNIPAGVPSRNTASTANNLNNVVASDIRVLMTYGYEDNLFAKITSGSQGGYVVKRGDILPDGKEVVSVQPNFIEVRTPKAKGKYQKIYVTGPAPTNASGLPVVNSASSANLSPFLGPVAVPQMVQSGNMISLPAPNNLNNGNNNGNNGNTSTTPVPVGNPITIPVR